MYAKINRCFSVCPFYGGCPHLGGSVKRGSPVLGFFSKQTWYTLPPGLCIPNGIVHEDVYWYSRQYGDAGSQVHRTIFLIHRQGEYYTWVQCLLYRIVRIISPWAIFLTTALNRCGLIIHTELVYELPYISYRRTLSWRGGWAYNTSWAYNTYYTVFNSVVGHHTLLAYLKLISVDAPFTCTRTRWRAATYGSEVSCWKFNLTRYRFRSFQN